jgi:hypothetical protein
MQGGHNSQEAAVTGLCGQRITSQGRAQAFSSMRSISTSYWHTIWKAVSLCSLCHKEAKAVSKPLFWGCLCFMWLGRQEASFTLHGAQKAGLRAIWKVLPAWVWDLSQPDQVQQGWALRSCPFLAAGSMVFPSSCPHRAGSGSSTLAEASMCPGWWSPAQHWLLGAQPQVWLLYILTKQRQSTSPSAGIRANIVGLWKERTCCSEQRLHLSH